LRDPHTMSRSTNGSKMALQLPYREDP